MNLYMVKGRSSDLLSYSNAFPYRLRRSSGYVGTANPSDERGAVYSVRIQTAELQLTAAGLSGIFTPLPVRPPGGTAKPWRKISNFFRDTNHMYLIIFFRRRCIRGDGLAGSRSNGLGRLSAISAASRLVSAEAGFSK